MNILPKNTLLGELTIRTTYKFYDIPRLFSCSNKAGTTYLALSTADDGSEFQWLYVPVSIERLSRLLNKQVDLRSCFLSPEDGYLFRVISGLGGTSSVEHLFPEQIPNDDLPENGVFIQHVESNVVDLRRGRERYESSPFSVRFVGPDLSRRGVSIYDLGTTLLAVQRIVHKAYLSQQGRLKKGAFPSKQERPSLALQLGERRRASDAFSLVPILQGDEVERQIKNLIDYIISGVTSYYDGNVLDIIDKETNNEKKVFIGSIYTEVAKIVNRINTVGGVEGISLGAPALERETVAAFSAATKEYLADLHNKNFYGELTEFTGTVYKLYPNSNLLGVRLTDQSVVMVHLLEEDYDKIHAYPKKAPKVIFKGRPIYKFGIETTNFDEFDASEIMFPDAAS